MGMPNVILLIETSRAYGRGLLRGIARHSRLHGPWSFYREPLCYAYGGPSAMKRTLSQLKHSDADGVIGHALDETNARRIIEANIPAVAEGARDAIPGLVNIVCDDAAIGRMAAEHLLDRGFRNFAYCGFDYMPWSQRRNESFGKRIAQAGFTSNKYKQSRSKGRLSWTVEQMRIADWLKSLPKPVGLMACNDDRSEHVTESCKIAGFSVPEQVAIIGVDNDALVCDLSDPPLSSVALNCEKAGYEAAELLDKLMKREKVAHRTIPNRPTHVVARQSTDILAIEDSEVTKAVRFIRENCAKFIQVSDVLDAVTLSRRSLEGRFRKVLRRSIHDEIKRVRVAQIAKMLVETNLPVSEIALALDFSTADHICRYFRNETKISPSAYRKQCGCKTVGGICAV